MSERASQQKVADLAKRIADYMLTRNTPWGTSAEVLHDIVREAIRLAIEDAVHETYPLARVNHQILKEHG